MESSKNLPLVFVVDDSTTILNQVRECLRDNFQVRTINSAAMLIKMAQMIKLPPDILLLDVEMPDMNGGDAVPEILKMPGWQKVPILLLTAWDTDSVLSHLFELGAMDVISKPIISSVLLARVSNYVKLGKLL